MESAINLALFFISSVALPISLVPLFPDTDVWNGLMIALLGLYSRQTPKCLESTYLTGDSP